MLIDSLYCEDNKLPQYGRLVAICASRTAKPNYLSGLLFAVGGFIGLALVMGTIANALTPEGGEPNETVSVIIGFASLFVMVVGGLLIYWHIWEGTTESPLEVYEGGMHLEHSVSTISHNGRWVTIEEGLRKVSRPWRLVKKITLEQSATGGEMVFDANIQFTDGDSLKIRATDPGDTQLAIETIVASVPDKVAR